MTHRYLVVVLVALTQLSGIEFFAIRAQASQIMAIRVRPIIAILEPSDQKPTRLLLKGAISINPNNGSMTYLAPRCGALYFSCPPGAEAACKLEWADLIAAAQKGTCVVFGGWRGPPNPPRLRSWDEVPTAPDPYAVNLGVATVPCMPELPGPERPDLTMSCPASGVVDGGTDARASNDRSADSAPGRSLDVASNSQLADAASMTGPGHADGPTPSPVAPISETPVPAAPRKSSGGCHVGGSSGGPGAAFPFSLLTVALMWAHRERRRR